MDPMVLCPYDETHQVRKSKLPYHLTRCKLNNNRSTNDSKVCCPFDAFHIIDKELFESHIDECPNVGNVKNFIHNWEPQRLVGIVPLEKVKKLTVPIMKNWKEEGVETYDPWKNTYTRNIIRCKSGGSKTQKKEFKLAERKRLESLKKEDKFKIQETVSFKHNPLKKYKSVSQLIRNLRSMSLDNFDTLLESIDIGKLRISEVNKFQEYKYISQLAEGMLTQKLKELVLHCMKIEVKYARY